jgi:hypothetical protein
VNERQILGNLVFVKGLFVLTGVSPLGGFDVLALFSLGCG